MGAQWKQKWRELSAHQRGQQFGKLVKEIQVAAKIGGPEPDLNARLYAACAAARKESVPRDTIERAIKKGAGLLDGEKVNYEEVLYEGFAPHKIPVMVECLTDNRNRSFSEVRTVFNKSAGGTLGTAGSVAFMFDHVGVVEAVHTDTKLDAEEAAIEAGANEVEPLDDEEKVPEGQKGARFLCDRPSLNTVSKELAARKWTIVTAEMAYIAKDYPELSDEQREEVGEFLRALDDNGDVHRVYAAIR